MPAERGRWAEAYAEQSLSDWRVYLKLLADGDVELCHSLHYLQMACEKIAKAYRLRDTDVDFASATKHHVGFTAFAASYLQSDFVREYYADKPQALAQVYAQGVRLARKIERLAPAVDSDQTPSNAEYPWAVGDKILVPCKDSFGDLATLGKPPGLNFLKFIRLAITEYASVSLS